MQTHTHTRGQTDPCFCLQSTDGQGEGPRLRLSALTDLPVWELHAAGHLQTRGHQQRRSLHLPHRPQWVSSCHWTTSQCLNQQRVFSKYYYCVAAKSTSRNNKNKETNIRDNIQKHWTLYLTSMSMNVFWCFLQETDLGNCTQREPWTFLWGRSSSLGTWGKNKQNKIQTNSPSFMFCFFYLKPHLQFSSHWPQFVHLQWPAVHFLQLWVSGRAGRGSHWLSFPATHHPCSPAETTEDTPRDLPGLLSKRIIKKKKLYSDRILTQLQTVYKSLHQPKTWLDRWAVVKCL